jgi:ATP-dependent DNA helicase RecQ
MISAQTLLKDYFGYDNFRPLQAEIIEHIIKGNDALVLMPTGGGKSICYQIPALVFEGLTLVISPLIALMKDQVESLRANGIKASFINSSLSQSEQDAVLWAAKLGELKLLYIAPERLFAGNTLSFFRELNISLIAVDEAHCISSWGHDFRPEYRQLSVLKGTFSNTPIIALTATADRVTRRDICSQMGIDEGFTFLSSFDRPNISLEVLPGQQRLKQIQFFLNARSGQSGIIYCLSRKGTETVSESLNAMGFKTAAYHAGLDAQKRSEIQNKFINDDTPIIVATVAFGMGIDKSNVRWIIHYNLPSNVESYYQEIGRAGRDGLKAETILFYSYADIIQRRRMIFDSEQSELQKELLEAKLERMKQYAESNICRRRMLISYFNEDLDRDCKNCDVCRNPKKQFDASVLAQKALSAISRTSEKIALGMLVDILRGSRNQSLVRLGYDKLPTFGVGHDLKTEVWVDFVLQFLNYGAMDIAYDEGHCFKLNEVSKQILKGKRQVFISEYISVAERQSQVQLEFEKKPSKTQAAKGELFDKLKILRKQIADSLGMPAYIVFSDASLQDMVEKLPLDKLQFLAVHGVGQEKYSKYGDLFIQEILEYTKGFKANKVVLPKGKTAELSYNMYVEGKSVEEIAEARALSKASVLGHLLTSYQNGSILDLNTLIESKELTAISLALLQIDYKEGEPMKKIFEFLKEEISYDSIRIALTILGKI